VGRARINKIENESKKLPMKVSFIMESRCVPFKRRQSDFIQLFFIKLPLYSYTQNTHPYTDLQFSYFLCNWPPIVIHLTHSGVQDSVAHTVSTFARIKLAQILSQGFVGVGLLALCISLYSGAQPILNLTSKQRRKKFQNDVRNVRK